MVASVLLLMSAGLSAPPRAPGLRLSKAPLQVQKRVTWLPHGHIGRPDDTRGGEEDDNTVRGAPAPHLGGRWLRYCRADGTVARTGRPT